MSQTKQNWKWEYRAARNLINDMGFQAYSDLYDFYGANNEDDLKRDKLINTGILVAIKHRRIKNGIMFMIQNVHEDERCSNRNLARTYVEEIFNINKRKEYLTKFKRPYEELTVVGPIGNLP